MKIYRVAIFVIFVWFSATVPWLLTRALYANDWIKWSLIFGSVNTIAVVSFLLFWNFIQKRFKILSLGLSLAIIYFLLSIGILIMGFLGQAKEPLIWEGVAPLIIMLCPVSLVIRIFHFIHFPWYLILGICVGLIFYFYLGKAFDKFVTKK